MDYVYYAVDYSDSLAHHGIKGQKWGIRRYQNSDGSLTPEGYRHWGFDPATGRQTRAGKSEHTKQRTKEFAKTGAKVALTLGSISGATGMAVVAATGMAPLLGVYGLTTLAGVASSTASTAAGAAFVGRMVGKRETKKAQRQIRKANKNGKKVYANDLP